MPGNVQKKIVKVLIPALMASFLNPPVAMAVTELHGKAKITSCAVPEKPRPSPYPLYRRQLGAGVTGGVAPSGMPAPQMMESAADRSGPVSKKPKGKKPGEKKEGLDLQQAGKRVDKNIQKAGSLYLSNDDSMSLASAQRIIYAIDNFLPLYRNEIRPHEFLNYFHFETNPVVGDEKFSVNFQMAPRTQGDSLALAVQGKKLTKENRKPAVITLILDKSGSMRSQGKMEYLKEGMDTLKAQLKKDDVINVIEFDHEVCKAMEGFVVGRDPWAGYDKTVQELEPRGSTDLHAGLVDGYSLAKKFYDPGKINRVILITDAIANTGTLSPDLMASITKYYDTKKIALSGIGVGLDFNDDLLNTLTDRGKGAYLFLGLQAAIPRVFGTDFISLLETVARDVHFKVTFPKDLHLEVFYGEEVSTEKEKVQPIHYFANTSQLFLLDLKGKVKEENPQFELQIEFTDPDSGEKEVETLARTIPQIKDNGQKNIAKARLIMTFTDLLEKTALPGKRPYGGWFRKPSPEVPNKAEGKKLCTETKTEMKKQQALYSDSETVYVLDLTDKYCSRF